MSKENRPTKRKERKEQLEKTESPKFETLQRLSKEDVDIVAGGRPPIHTPPQ